MGGGGWSGLSRLPIRDKLCPVSQAHPADEILLRVPARAPYARIVRAGVETLAERRGFSKNQIKDLGSAAEEAISLLISANGQQQDGEETVIECVFRLNNDALEIEAAPSNGSPLPPEASNRFSRQASHLVDDCHLDKPAGRIRLRKLSQPPT